MQIQEALRLYTEDKQPLGRINEKQYCNIEKINFRGKEVFPWVERVSCFVICRKDKSVAIQRKGKKESIFKELSLCSGYVRDGEINRMAMVRKLYDEMGFNNFSIRDLVDTLEFCGKVKMDFTKSNSEQNSNLRAFTSFYAIVVDEKSKIFTRGDSNIQIAWANYREVKKAIRASMFECAYTKENSKSFEKTFENIDKIVEGKDFNMSLNEYEREWL